jgi:hypothetical protein
MNIRDHKIIPGILLSMTLMISSVSNAGLFKAIHWYKIKASGEQSEGVDLSDTEAELWVYNKDRSKSTRKIFQRSELIKEVSFEDAGLKNRHVVLVRTTYTQEALCRLYRVYEDQEIYFFCDEVADTPFGRTQGRIHYKGSLSTTMIELLEFQNFKKGDTVALREAAGKGKAGSTWRIKHLFANGRVVLEPGYAPLLRPFGEPGGPTTNIENLEIVVIQQTNKTDYN